MGLSYRRGSRRYLPIPARWAGFPIRKKLHNQKNLRITQLGVTMKSSSPLRRKEPAMLLLLRFTGHKKLASVLGLLTTVAGLTFGILTHNHMWLITSLVGLGLSFLQLRHQRQEASSAAGRR
jgi:hypothetical protein